MSFKERNKNNIDLQKFIFIYNLGYHAGHHDTVEGNYTDIFPCDMKQYHEDIVAEILDEKYKIEKQ